MKKCIFTLCLIMVSGFLSAQSVDRKITLQKGNPLPYISPSL